MNQHIPDLRSYAFHQRAAEKLLSDPTLLNRVYEILLEWSQKEGEQAQLWAFKWIELIDELEIKEITKLITTKSEEMDFYRKSSPFSCILTQDERMEIINKYKFNSTG